MHVINDIQLADILSRFNSKFSEKVNINFHLIVGLKPFYVFCPCKLKTEHPIFHYVILHCRIVSLYKQLSGRGRIKRKKSWGRYWYTYFSCLHLFCSSSKCNIRVICAGTISFFLLHCWDKWRTSTIFPLFNPVLIHFSDQFIIFLQQQFGLLQADWLNVKPSMSLSYSNTQCLSNSLFKVPLYLLTAALF